MDATCFASTDDTAQAALRVLAGAGFDLGPAAPVSRTLLDTFDGRLHAAGLRLELCRTPTPEVVLWAGGAVAGRARVTGVPRRSGDLAPGPVRTRVRPVTGTRALLPVLVVAGRARTAVRRDRAGSAKVVVAVTEAVEVDGAGIGPRCLLEVVARPDHPKAARRTRDLLDSLGLRRLDGDTLVAAAALAGIGLDGFRSSPTVPLDPREPALDAFCRVLANLAVAVDANRHGAVESLDIEFLHDLRVAVRRTRSVLAEGGRVLPPAGRHAYRAGFGWLGAATGPARDLDVLLVEWEGYLAALTSTETAALEVVRQHLGRRRAAEQPALADALRSDRCRILLAGWQGWLAAPEGAPGPDAKRRVATVAAARIGRAQRRLLRRGRAIGPATPAAELHELRKDAKRLRYLLECLGALYPTDPRRAFVRRLKALQDNLGEHQDTEVHEIRLRAVPAEVGGASPDTAAALDRLVAELERRRGAARAAFSRTFAGYDTAATAAALDRLVRRGRA